MGEDVKDDEDIGPRIQWHYINHGLQLVAAGMFFSLTNAQRTASAYMHFTHVVVDRDGTALVLRRRQTEWRTYRDFDIAKAALLLAGEIDG